MDNATDAPVITIKEGRVTKKVELVPDGKGAVQEFVMETRTISKDKKTVTTEHFTDKPLDPEGYTIQPAGTKIVENRVNGITVKETTYRPNGDIKQITEFKGGKAIETRTFREGKTTSINNETRLDIRKHGDLITREMTEGKTDYWYGGTLLNGKVVEIGFKTKAGFDVMDIMKRVDGKLRVDVKKLLKIDPDAKGLPKDLKLAETGMKILEPVKKVLDQLDIKSDVQQTIMKSLDIDKEFNRILEGSTGTKSEKEFKAPAGFEVMDIMKRVDGKLRVDAEKLLEIDPDAKGLPIEGKIQYSKNKLSKTFNEILEEVEGIKAEKTYSEAKGVLEGAKAKGKWFGTPGAEDFTGLVAYAFAGKGKQGVAHIKFFNDNLQKPFNRAYNEIHNRKHNIGLDYKALRKAMPEVRKTLNEQVDGVYTVDQAIRVYNFNKAGFEVPGLSKTDLKKLVNYVESNPKVAAFADQLSRITVLPEGYLKPANHWLGENITMDMNNVVERVFRKEALAEFMENRKAIFGEWNGGRIVGENMNKIEAIHGPKHREALENMLWRMENGTNRTVGAELG